jgi:DNA integrity scanning protein DisA with diadenylate cyclase activity
VRLAQTVPLQERWLDHLVGLAKSDGATIFNDRLEACQFRVRLKPTNVCLLPDQDDLGSGMRHQVTREFSAFAPGVLGICISQDGHISLYRRGTLVSRLY